MSEIISPPLGTPGLQLTQTQKDLVGGSIGGIAQVLVGQPFDIVKVRIQTSPSGTYSSPLECAKSLLKADGPRGFYKGTLTPLLGIGACVSIQFSGMEAAKRFFRSRKSGGSNSNTQLGLGELWASGAFAGVANTAVANPVEHIRIRLQTQPASPKLYSGPLDCLVKLYQNGGISQVFRAQVPCMLRDGMGMGCYFLTYEALVQRHLRVNGGERGDISPLFAVGYGAAAGYGLWFSIYPVDVIKSKLQTDALDPAKRQYKGMIDCVSKVWRTQGWRGFTGGLGPTLIRHVHLFLLLLHLRSALTPGARSPFANGATFVAFELAMRAMA